MAGYLTNVMVFRWIWVARWVGSCVNTKGVFICSFACVSLVFGLFGGSRVATHPRFVPSPSVPMRARRRGQPRHDPAPPPTHELHAAGLAPLLLPRIDNSNKSRPSPLPTHNMQDYRLRALRVENERRVERMCTSVHI